jgi:hypothetical protein
MDEPPRCLVHGAVLLAVVPEGLRCPTCRSLILSTTLPTPGALCCWCDEVAITTIPDTGRVPGRRDDPDPACLVHAQWIWAGCPNPAPGAQAVPA